MIVVTGATGFIGTNLIRGLNQAGETNILAVCDLSDGNKITNISDCYFVDYMDKNEFIRAIKSNSLPYDIRTVFHQGACSSTMENNGQYMMENNFEYSKALLHYCLAQGASFLYASSASIYGLSRATDETLDGYKPLNIYAFSKLLFDRYVQTLNAPKSQVVGLRYFNVYGPYEQHKGKMASVAFHFFNQIKQHQVCSLFEGTNGIENGEQMRDFVYVEDVVKANLWLWQNPQISGVFNCGSGHARSFNDMANCLIDELGGEIRYIPFPKTLEQKYQSFTQADLTKLREVGYPYDFLSLEQGVKKYLSFLSNRA